ncbi:hypothetical protein EPUS_01776 [Endocarpon pusillum Z07020]|uniref:Uncharacterized protein n=1 Tax=Endocarpon pusillum (strain Z07020 / HMAS-L-300199) TaxID=1263415 RepID=U1GJ40_ENDPU|nr:uncharacterized protein EPUS_01776 [Endocarpon pusillum Z07020]ERF71861.1 hypothetical protein EPUS_01776 [Endocarpon pusillum Z07020]
MGVCLSCLGISHQSSSDPERSHLLSSDDPYNASGYGCGSTSQGLAPPRHVLNPEDVKREQEALEQITRWTTDAVIDIFPHQAILLSNSSTNLNPSNIYDQIPGDKSSKHIRIYPASRPVSQASTENSMRSRSSTQNRGAKAAQPRIFRTLEMRPGD